jgi:hypothetical protein
MNTKMNGKKQSTPKQIQAAFTGCDTAQRHCHHCHNNSRDIEPAAEHVGRRGGYCPLRSKRISNKDNSIRQKMEMEAQ